MTAPAQVIQQLVFWTDPEKVVGITKDEYEKSPIQANIAIEILQRATDSDSSK